MASKLFHYKLLYEQDPSLKDKELFKFYNKFSNICIDKSDFPDICNDDSSYNSVDPSVRKLYTQFERNLRVINDNNGHYFKDMTTDKDKRCIYLRYWFYDRVVQEDYKIRDVNKFFEAWKSRQNDVCINCGCNFSIMKWTEVYNVKKFYDLLLFYGKTDDIVTNKKDEIADSKYCTYLKNAYVFYTLREIQYPDNKGAYCEEVDKYIKNNIHEDQLKELTCNSEKNGEEVPDTEGSLASNALQKGSSSEYGDKGRALTTGKDDTNALVSPSNTVITLFGKFFGVSLISLILYRFTTFGPWVKHRMRKMNIIWNNIKDESINVLLNKHKSLVMYSNTRPYNIAYHTEEIS
ncbi:PIR Superfamily Protein [Plasmodium ovale wallikeri]|uniref:PIR Superfamily Protein n=1 Tax=Plasmodium ovale wallikeri TaxID=864142 RepID=A0A1A9AJA9_PLAOA|nr:PIR Superfamily Protein [Plasmodium ovale wallikeri]SBT56289.1 PIR Superfamily Protein [Plasmodium ovale wallikeri]